MSTQEAQRFAIIKRVIDGLQTQALAAQQLKLSTRQIKCLCKAVRAGGAGALISKRRGQPSNRRTPTKRKHDIMALLKAQYSDFEPLLAGEYLAKHHNETLSAEILRQRMIQEGLWNAKVKRKVRQHPSRAAA